MAAWTTTVSFAGGALKRPDLVASGERAMYATFGFVALASAGLITALVTHDFSLKYVASFSSANLPLVYTITAFWAGQAGSLLFWALILALYSALAVFGTRRRNRALAPYVAGTLGATLLFFLATLCLGASPFERLDWTPVDGRGMNPQLQNPGMAIHPPMLYLGYVATTVPFAYAVAALLSRKLDAEWLVAVRRWALVSWFFLTVGITLGMWWAYVELGWGGYWAWDPVENASLLPWLTGTAFLHSIMIQEKRGMLRKWNVTLVVSTFLLSILGTFITRSGIISSVHSFAQSPVGSWFAGFLIVALVATVYLVGTRLKDLEAKAELESMVSREAAFLYNNLVLCGIAFSVLWGTLFPIVSEAVKGNKITVGPPFFNSVNVPLGLLLLALTGVGPLIAWRRASASNLRRQFTVPVLIGLAVGVALFALGMRDAYALVAYTLAGFVTGTILQEFWKGVGARVRMHDENPVARALPARGPQPPPLRRLRGAHGDRGDVRRLRRARLQEGVRHHAQAGRLVLGGRPVGAPLDVHEPGRLELRAAQPAGAGDRRSRPRATAARPGSSRARSGSTWTARGTPPSSLPPRSGSSARSGRTSTSCSRAWGPARRPRSASPSTRSSSGCGTAG
jgi:cytochrome c-type biogenesis protein CcmF